MKTIGDAIGFLDKLIDNGKLNIHDQTELVAAVDLIRGKYSELVVDFNDLLNCADVERCKKCNRWYRSGFVCRHCGYDHTDY